jgi:coenzyme F420-0:L-glutamate ligase/coenzyme F420-1:gamma-L-glutamate ligase
MQAEEAHSFLRSRRSVRRYGPRLPSAESIQRIFATASQAPSAHNRQPWRFLVLSSFETKDALASAMARRLVLDRQRDGDPEDMIEQDVQRSRQRITDAPIVIVIALTLEEMDSYPDGMRRQCEYLMAVQSTAMATQNLLLSAHAEGLGACWMCAPLFCPDDVKAALQMSDSWHVQGLVTLGYPSQPGRVRARKSVSDFVIFE